MTNAFIGHEAAPAAAELAAALGSAAARWDRLRAVLAEELQLAETEWKSYSRNAGWSLRVKQGKRNIVYLSPGEGAFSASLVLGDRALAAIREGRFPKGVTAAVAAAMRYPEGTALRIEVRSDRDVDTVRRLAAVKLAH
jgi:hypothetical protein